MSRDNPWAKHRQSYWQEKAGRPSLPLWLRISALAYGVHRRNGHAPFKSGEIALATTVVDTETGELRTPSPNRVSEAIRQAIDLGFLSPESSARCLVVPSWGIEGGMLGSPHEKCRHHRTSGKTGKKAPKLPEIPETTSGKTGNADAVSRQNATPLYDSSLPDPRRTA